MNKRLILILVVIFMLIVNFVFAQNDMVSVQNGVLNANNLTVNDYVGIGTNNPASGDSNAKLDVNGDIIISNRPTGAGELQRGSNTAYISLLGGTSFADGAGVYLAGNSFAGVPTLSGGDVAIVAGTNSNIRFQQSGTDLVVIKSDGNVGIGTPTPANPLHIEGGNTKSQFKTSAGSSGIFSVTSYAADNVQIGFDTDYDSGWKARDASIATITKASDMLRIRGSVGNTLGQAATFNDLMAVSLGTGNVGIGTTSPTTNLDVHSDTSYSVVTIGTSAVGQDSGINFATSTYTGGNNQIRLRNTDGHLDFMVGGQKGLSISQTGHVGIGTDPTTSDLTANSGDIGGISLLNQNIYTTGVINTGSLKLTPLSLRPSCDQTKNGVLVYEKVDDPFISYSRLLMCMQMSDTTYGWVSVKETSWT